MAIPCSFFRSAIDDNASISSLSFRCSVKNIVNVGKAYDDLMSIIVRLASYGLIHCDFNEFNLMISDEGKITMIDFPQMVSISHLNAEFYFDRDVQCIRDFFKRRFDFDSDAFPRFSDIKCDDSFPLKFILLFSLD